MARRGSFRDGGGPSSEESLPSANDGCGPVLGQIHVSCYVTAANRATPVFDVLPQHNCVRVVSRPNSDSSAGQYGASGTSTGAMPSAEWEFHSVFSSSSHSHAIDFFTEITLPALRTARDGINSNIVVWGVHPTQKFRLLFGKSVGGGGFAPQAEMAVNDVVELYGQLVGMLHAFFSQLDLGSRQKLGQDAEPWRLGISSWIIVNNQAIDLLKAPIGGTSGDGSRMSTSSALHDSLSFVSLEATSLATAFRIVQTAKTNRIVRKQNTESVHFFVRLALFHGGQVSTVHLVDIIDQKDFQDHVLVQEKLEFYNILQSLRLPSPSPRQSGTNGASSVDSLRSVGKMLLSNFMLPLLTANAKTFMYANVIDSRTNLRESVQMLNAVANLRCFACVCRPLRGVSYEQLGFQASPDDFERQEPCSQQEQLGKNQIQTDVESRPILNRSASSPPLGASHHASSSINPSEKQFLDARSSALISRDGESESDAMSWLNAFAQRKRDILGGSIDMIDTAPLTTRVTENPVTDPMIYTASENRGEHGICEQTCGTPSMNPSVADLYEQLRESLEDVKDIELAKPKTPRASYCSLHSSPPDQSVPDLHAPLPIVDQYDDQEVDYAHIGYSRSTIGGITRHQMQQQTDDEVSTWTQTNYAAINHFQNREVTDADDAGSRPEVDPVELKSMPATSFSSPATLPTPSLASKPDKITLEVFKKAGVHPSALEPPNLDGLDVKTAQKVQAADATLLRKNYDALLSIVREQQQAKEAAEAHAAEALHDQEEMRAMFEVQIENMKLANVGLRSKVRALENKTSLPQVFEQYEQELRTLHAQVQELQARNVALELRAGDGGGSGAIGSSVPSSDIKKKYQQVVEEKLELEREVMEHRRRERHHQVHSRLAGESTRRVDRLSRDLNSKEEDLVAARLSKQRLSAEMNQALEKADQLHHENEKLLQEKAATTEELLATRMYLASLENEKKKASILDRFVEKHGDRMSKLRQHGHSSTQGEKWRRDQFARECEDKLLAAVKRSLPQAVPLCNKLLRRLEVQELSLREFSEREVDFINLLVELVSDQPTVSLKQMIEQEMRKLQSH